MRCRVFLIENSAPMRDAISSILAGECDLLGWSDDGCKALDTAVSAHPEVVLLDISLPGVSGLTLLPELRSLLPETAIVILTNHSSDEYIEEAFRRGASEYVLKNDAHVALLHAIQRAFLQTPSAVSGSVS